MQIFGKGSDNIEDSRGSSGGRGGRTILGGGIGLLVVIVGLFFGKDLTGLVSQMPDSNLNVRVAKGLPADQKVYIDLTFYDELANRFGAAGDFEQAYVIAHEVGHQVQNLLGISEKLDRARGQVSGDEYNKLSVKLEL